jgi:1-phosphatidylinositol-4-phosphate 5-kinase
LCGTDVRRQPESAAKIRRRKTERERGSQDPTEVRKAVERSDPKAIDESNRLPDRDRSERRHFIFYQDEGGLRATDPANQPLDTIYYLGIIDILTPYGFKKCMENFFKGLVEDKVGREVTCRAPLTARTQHAISPVPPTEYGQRFTQFIISSVAGSKLRPDKTSSEENEKANGQATTPRAKQE